MQKKLYYRYFYAILSLPINLLLIKVNEMPAKKATAKAAKPAKKTSVKASAKATRPAKKTSVKASAKATSPAKKLTAIKTPFTKAQTISAISEAVDLPKQQVVAVFNELSDITERHIKARGAGQFTVPGLSVKIKVIDKPATKARKGVNPFTGEEIMIKAKPKRKVVKVSPLKKLKEMVA